MTIETAAKGEYRAARLVNPERIYFDLAGAKLRAAQTIPAGGGLLRQVRAAPREGGVVRVVLDLEAPAEFTATWLSGPNRLEIDLRRAGAPRPAPTPAPTPQIETPAPPPAPIPLVRPRILIPRTGEPAPVPPPPRPAPQPPPARPTESAPPRPFVVEQIVAKVNNDIITQGEIDRTRKQIEDELRRQQVPQLRVEEAGAQAGVNALRDRIDQLLLVQKAKELNINVDAEVSKYMAQLQLESKLSDPDKFQEWIREQSGVSYEDFKQQSRDGMLTREVLRHEVAGRMTIPRTELRKYYDEHPSEFVRDEQTVLREILLSTAGKDAAAIAAIEKKAKDLAARARKGENFATLAHDNSDAETARNFGELPPFKRGDLRKDIEALVFDKSKGYVTDPIRQPNGFLILRVEERYQAGLQPLELVETEVMEKLYRPRMDPATRLYLIKLRQEAFLQIRAGYVDTGAAPGKDTSWKDPVRLMPATTTKQEVYKRVHRRRLLWLVPVPGTKPKAPQE